MYVPLTMDSVFLSQFRFITACHRRAVTQPCLNGDRLSKGRMAKFDPAQTRNPSTDRHKIWNKWLRPRGDPLRKISCKFVHWGFSANGWNITKIFLVYIYTFFCWPIYRSDRLADFHARWLGQRGFTQGSTFSGTKIRSLYLTPEKSPQSRKLGLKRT